MLISKIYPVSALFYDLKARRMNFARIYWAWMDRAVLWWLRRGPVGSFATKVDWPSGNDGSGLVAFQDWGSL